MIVLDPALITVVDDWHQPANKYVRTFQALVDLPSSFKLLPSERQVAVLTESLTNRTLPSAKVTSTPPGWKLLAAL